LRICFHADNVATDFQQLFVVPSQTIPVHIGEFGPALDMTLADAEALMQRTQALGIPWTAWNLHMRCGNITVVQAVCVLWTRWLAVAFITCQHPAMHGGGAPGAAKRCLLTMEVTVRACVASCRCPPNLLVDNSNGGCGLAMPLQLTQYGQLVKQYLQAQ
jgi:hypothetical protein